MTVYFDEVKNYELSSIESSIKNAFVELRVDLHGKKSAFIKVNIVRPAKMTSCVITHPNVVEALIIIFRESGIKQIMIGEGPAAGVNVREAFKKSGYHHLCEKMKVKFVDINSAKGVAMPWDHGLLELPSELLESDVYINVPKMKTHFHTGVTLSIKSQQGLLSPEAKKANHRDYDLHESLVAIGKVIQPDLIIIDAIHSMEGEGPTKGDMKNTEVLVYGDDLLETDIACCRFMGISPSQIKHISYAIQEKLGSTDPEIKGSAFAKNRTSFKMPSPKPKKIVNFYSWKNYRACAEDEHSFEEAIHMALVNPKYWFQFFPKFLYFVIFKRFDLLRGKKAKIPEDAGRILCIGDCCREVALENNTYHVSGCPPKPEDILDTISSMKLNGRRR